MLKYFQFAQNRKLKSKQNGQTGKKGVIQNVDTECLINS